MTLQFRRRGFVLGSAATGLYVAAGLRPAWSQEPLKVGFIYVGPATDNGWSYRHDVARKEVEAAFPGKVTTTAVESVGEGPDAERVIRQLATTGHGLIFTTSFGFMNPTLKVAKQFPNVKFEHATGYQVLPNVAVYNARFYEGRAVIGTMAGMMSKTGVVGYIGSVPDPGGGEGRRGLYRLVLDPRGGNGHQRLHARRAKGKPKPSDQGGVGQFLARPGQGRR